MEYILAELNIPKNKKIVIKNGKKTYPDWYIYYSYRDPETGKMKRFKERAGFVGTDKEKKENGTLKVAARNELLKSSWSPFLKEEEIKKSESEKQNEINRFDFHWWFLEKVKSEKGKKESFYNWRKLDGVQRKLKAFREKLSIHDVDTKFLDDFKDYLMTPNDKGKVAHINYVADILTRVKVIMQQVVDSGDVLYHKNPFLKYKIKTVRTEKERLQKSDIEILRDFDLSGNKDVEQARDMYMLSFYLAGVRFGDICRVQNDWFDESHTRYTMNKTKKKRKLKIMPELAEIIDKYKNDGKYLFDAEIDWDNELQSINNKNTTWNNRLKRACKLAKVQPITFHTSRNSVADAAKKAGTDSHTLKGLFGHSKIQTTEIYMSDFYEEESDDAMDKIFGKSEIPINPKK